MKSHCRDLSFLCIAAARPLKRALFSLSGLELERCGEPGLHHKTSSSWLTLLSHSPYPQPHLSLGPSLLSGLEVVHASLTAPLLGRTDPSVLPVHAGNPQHFFRDMHSSYLTQLIFYSDSLIPNPLLHTAFVSDYDDQSPLKHRKAGRAAYDAGDWELQK